MRNSKLFISDFYRKLIRIFIRLLQKRIEVLREIKVKIWERFIVNGNELLGEIFKKKDCNSIRPVVILGSW